MWSVKFLSVKLTIRDAILFGPHTHLVTYNKTLALVTPSPSFYCLSYCILVWQDAVRKKKKSSVSETLHTIPHSWAIKNEHANIKGSKKSQRCILIWFILFNILGITELKWTGMSEFNSDDHYIYYCGQESLRRNGVAIIVKKKKSPICSTWVQSQKWQNDLCSFSRQTIQYHSNPSLGPDQ